MDIYCNFAFRRQSKENYIIFTNIFYADKELKRPLEKKTRAYKMWENQQYVCAVQSYEYALNCIFESEYIMLKHNVDRVWLVTANSALVGWLKGSRHNEYEKWVKKARQPYLPGGKKEIHVEIGVLPAINNDPAYRYCKVANVENEIPFTKNDNTVNKVNAIGFNVVDILNDSIDIKKHNDDDIFQ